MLLLQILQKSGPIRKKTIYNLVSYWDTQRDRETDRLTFFS